MSYIKEYPRYGSPEESLKFEMDSDYELDELTSLGFFLHTDFLKGYFFISEEDDFFLELLCFRHTKEKSSICCLSDVDQEVFCFYCGNRQEEFACVKDLMEIALSMIEYQKITKELIR